MGPELERYEIIDELGHGGMSIVYRARDRQLSRMVAVKVLHEFLARQEEARKRFHREAMAVAKLHHPGILEIFDYSGPDARDAYIVTELIEGRTLREFMDEHGRPPHPEIAELIVLDLVRALRHAHEQSVIHRDLKPENVMITKDGDAKLMDFGLAQLMDGGSRLTATGTLLGSPAHMAPEVIDGQPSDSRADLFSMGTILYWLATGKMPFEAPNPSALFKKILDGNYEDPQQIEPRIGNALARIITRALEPDPRARYQDVTEIERDLVEDLETVALLPAEPNARRYFIDPNGFTHALGSTLIAALTRSGQAALASGQVARAMDQFNRVLAIDPGHAEVRSAVERIGRDKRLLDRARTLALLAAVMGLLSGAAYAAKQLFPAEQPPAPQIEVSTPTELPPQPIVETPTVTQTPPPVIEDAGVGTKTIRVRPSRLDAGKAEGGVQEPDAGVIETPPVEPPRTKLKIVIGGAAARKLIVDGREIEKFNGYRGSLELKDGTHEVEIEDANGRRERLVFEAQGGVVTQIDGDQRTPVPGNEARIRLTE